MFINEMRSYIAGRINCSPKNVFIVQNATDAFNCIAKSMKWAQGDVVLLPNIAYASIRKTVTVLKERYGVVIEDVSGKQRRWPSRQRTCSRRRVSSCGWRSS
jgi:selenocysteine lyase/cysteine desulfurase